MFLPFYILSNDTGKSGQHLGKTWFGASIGTEQTVCARGELGRFNPYSIQYGGTTLGFRGKNYWFRDKTFLGFIFKFIFK